MPSPRRNHSLVVDVTMRTWDDDVTCQCHMAQTSYGMLTHYIDIITDVMMILSMFATSVFLTES